MKRIVALVFLFVFLPFVCFSEEKASKDSFKLQEVGILTGYGIAAIEDGPYKVIPIIPYFGFNIKGLAKKINISPSGLFEFIIEPVTGVVFNPDRNAEIGINLLLKYGYKIFPRLYLNFKGGAGLIYITQGTHEQDTQFNFTPQAGMGFQYLLSKRWSLNLEYRYRHLSNAGISDPNDGIETHFCLFGISIFY